MVKDFSIFDNENLVEVMVICDFNYNTNKYEVIYSQTVDLLTGYPVTVSKSCMDYTNEINLKLKELNYDTIK